MLVHACLLFISIFTYTAELYGLCGVVSNLFASCPASFLVTVNKISCLIALQNTALLLCIKLASMYVIACMLHG